MDKVVRASLGPVPLPYIFLIVLLPVWLPFFQHDFALLHSLGVVMTILLKGALLSHWSSCRSVSRRSRLLSLLPALFLQIGVIHEALRISWVALVILVPLSCGIGALLCRLHMGQAGAESSNVIGIFSRSSPEEYRWLSEGLRSSGKVLPFCITNNNFREFRLRVSECRVAILYHSKTRGRVNITDVTDSLYDDEVTVMSETLGRSKVVVVVDDLDDSREEIKRGILHTQPTIGRKAGNLFLFTPQDKSDKMVMSERLRSIAEELTESPVLLIFSVTDMIAIVILAFPWIFFCYDEYQVTSLVLSNISGSLLLYFLLPSKSGPVCLVVQLLVVIWEIVVAFWNNSGMNSGLLTVQSLATMVLSLYSAMSLQSSSAAR